MTERLPTLITVQTILVLALSAPAVAQQNTWPSGRPVDGFAERVVQTDTVELGPYDCTPASALMAVRTLGVDFPETQTADAVAYIRREASWPLDGIGMSLMLAGYVLQNNGLGVEYVRDAGLADVGRGINRGGVGILCGRNAQQELHTIAVVDYNLDKQMWLIHDPDRDRPGWVSTRDLQRFREDRCEDKVDLLVQGANQRQLLPKISMSLREVNEQLEAEEAEKAARRERRREARGEEKTGKRRRKKSADGAEKQGKRAGKAGKSSGKSSGKAAGKSGKSAGKASKSGGKSGKSAGKATSKAKAKARRGANNAVSTTSAESESSVPGGSLGLGLMILAGLLVVLGGAIFGVRRGWFERYDLDDE